MTATLLDTRAAAQRTALAVQTLAKWRVLGGGPPFRKFGRRVLYDAAELERWIAAHPLRRSTADDGAHDHPRAA